MTQELAYLSPGGLTIGFAKVRSRHGAAWCLGVRVCAAHRRLRDARSAGPTSGRAVVDRPWRGDAPAGSRPAARLGRQSDV
jgi:hypothetical protein